MTVSLHPQADQILARLQQERIRALYHFTSIENLVCIRDMNALCSKQVLQNAGRWPVPEPGGNDLSHRLDRLNGNWDKISLNFTPHTPMVYHKKQASHLCFFVIRPSVATWNGVSFTNRNAASTDDQQRGQGIKGLNLVNFDAIRSRPQPWNREGWVRPVQAEVLVPNQIALDHVLEVSFVSDASREEAERLWGNHSHPQFITKPLHFSDDPLTVSLGFPCLEQFLLTDEIVTKENVQQARWPKLAFSRATCDRITVVAEVNATAGLQASITWGPINFTHKTEFETSTSYLHWPSIPIRRLPDGRCTVEYRLGDIRWATVEFEVSE